MENTNSHLHDVVPVSGMYENWFLEYASYVILERAVPALNDGLKPVQRRILHAMKEMDDGRYNKVANIIGQTMQYHPHGDASIGDAMVGLGQKDLLIDTQGNWGDVRTGDGAAAARYIEARLTKFGLEVVFNPQTTEWKLSYDGRKYEPVTLPVKFPLLLAQGTEGIAVGLSTKILPHNFIELIKASIEILNDKPVSIFPDFPTGGMIDVTNYNQGKKGGKVRVRARIEELDSKTLVIRDVPFGITTDGLMESIVKANDAGKIKIKKVIDNTAKDVEVQVQLAVGISPDITISALYAFTDCEISISPNACVILDDKPLFTSVDEMLRVCTRNTVQLLEKELQIRKHELLEKLLYSSLERIFIENKIYREIEEATTWEMVLGVIDAGIEPFKPQFYREITQDDILKLTEIKIKRISKFDAFKADELMRSLENELKEVEENLANLIRYAIDFYKNLLTKYSKGRERKTEIRTFDVITATKVAANNQKLYINRAEGFIGYNLKKDEYIADCSDIDDVIVFLRDGKFKVVKIAEKVFVGKDIIHAEVFNKDDERKVYNAAYLDGETGTSYVKRFQVGGITRDRENELTRGTKNSKVWYFTANLNGEAETITVQLSPGCKAKTKVFDFDFATLTIKGRSAQGNILSKYPVKSIKFKMAGGSTLGGLNIYFDAKIGRLNTEERGTYLGSFHSEDRILALYTDGTYEIMNADGQHSALANRFQIGEVINLYKFDPKVILSAVYFDGEHESFYIKRFLVETTTIGKKFAFITEHKKSKLLMATAEAQPQIKLTYTDMAKKEITNIYDVDLLTEVRGWKALGTRLPNQRVKNVQIVSSEESE